MVVRDAAGRLDIVPTNVGLGVGQPDRHQGGGGKLVHCRSRGGVGGKDTESNEGPAAATGNRARVGAITGHQIAPGAVIAEHQFRRGCAGIGPEACHDAGNAIGIGNTARDDNGFVGLRKDGRVRHVKDGRTRILRTPAVGQAGRAEVLGNGQANWHFDAAAAHTNQDLGPSGEPAGAACQGVGRVAGKAAAHGGANAVDSRIPVSLCPEMEGVGSRCRATRFNA